MALAKEQAALAQIGAMELRAQRQALALRTPGLRQHDTRIQQRTVFAFSTDGTGTLDIQM